MSEMHEHSNKTVVSVEGMKKLEEKLQYLTTVRRAEVAEQISIARGFGDLSENAEYDAAREEQGVVETRIAEIGEILQNAEIIAGGSKGKVGLGSVVELKSSKKSVEYALVGPVEADPLNGKISNESPIGMALEGKKVGETATITTPKGETEYEIISIK